MRSSTRAMSRVARPSRKASRLSSIWARMIAAARRLSGCGCCRHYHDDRIGSTSVRLYVLPGDLPGEDRSALSLSGRTVLRTSPPVSARRIGRPIRGEFCSVSFVVPPFLCFSCAQSRLTHPLLQTLFLAVRPHYRDQGPSIATSHELHAARSRSTVCVKAETDSAGRISAR